MLIGLLVILVGVVFLLHNVGLLPSLTWSVIWPIIIILIGVSMLERRRFWGRHGMRRRWKEKNWDKDDREKDDTSEDS